ncbi:carboxylesterase/lipase family protein [Marinobacter lacisalsi]|uniref:Carboxylic ester hydrolase n=1 Tax=Marinobacter lacisalsi TaxID=475979 RepID=A0ABV8QN32_9GAMM
MSCSTVLAATLLAGCGGGGGSGSDDETPTQVNTETTVSQGKVNGTNEPGMIAFRGIPYAQPPVGNLRFAPPQPAGAWEGTLQADEFGNNCPQTGSAFNGFADSLDEDCLFLNVYKPKSGNNLPVMVWIHGGAFITGSGGESYEPFRLVSEDVVVVTMNYRLGILGFLPAAGLPEGNGQFGLLDQQLALEWVQENIGAFGGNPDNVTIFGESAGGHSVLSQLVSAGASTGSEGLFHKAIVQSGAYQPTQIPQAVGETVIGAPVVAALGCESAPDVAACLRDEGITTEEILTAQGDMWFNPTWGQGMLPHSIQAALTQQGDATFPQGVPVMTGNNLNEGRLFLALDEIPFLLMDPPSPNPVDTRDEYDTELTALLGTDPRGLDVAQIGNDYLNTSNSPLNSPVVTDPADPDRFTLALASIQTSWRFACNQIDQVESLSAQGVNTYGYWFTDQDAPSLFGPLTAGLSFDLGAAHALEIQYVLNSEETMRERGATDAQIDLSEQMIQYWVQFARNGNPSLDDGTATWTAYGNGSELMELEPSTLGNAALVNASMAEDAHNCAYWDNPPLLPR